MSQRKAFPTKMHMPPAMNQEAQTVQGLLCSPEDALAPWPPKKDPTKTEQTVCMYLKKIDNMVHVQKVFLCRLLL